MKANPSTALLKTIKTNVYESEQTMLQLKMVIFFPLKLGAYNCFAARNSFKDPQESVF